MGFLIDARRFLPRADAFGNWYLYTYWLGRACVLGFTLSLTLTFPPTRYLCAYICWSLGREETGGRQQGLIEAPPQQLDSLDRTLQP